MRRTRIGVVGIVLLTGAAIGESVAFIGNMVGSSNLTLFGIAIVVAPALVVVAKLLHTRKDATNTIESIETLASDEVKWRYAPDSELVEYFLGENVWSKEWREVGLAEVLEPTYDKPRSFSIYAAEFADQTRLFVAGEATNGAWIFYIPE